MRDESPEHQRGPAGPLKEVRPHQSGRHQDQLEQDHPRTEEAEPVLPVAPDEVERDGASGKKKCQDGVLGMFPPDCGADDKGGCCDVASAEEDSDEALSGVGASGHDVPVSSVGMPMVQRTGLDPIAGEGTVWVIQVVLIVIGHLFGVVVAHRISRKLFADSEVGRKAATKSLVPTLIMMVLLSIAGLWLMHLDMNMRMGRM